MFGRVDQYSMHAGCPIKEGEKWASNLWFFNRDTTHPGRPTIAVDELMH